MSTPAVHAPTVPLPPATPYTPEIQGIGLGLVAAAIWGAYLAMAKAGVSAGLEPSDIAFIRYAVAGLVMLPWLLIKGVRACGGVGWGRATILSLLVGPLFILIGVGGYQFAPLAHGAVMQPAALTIVSLVLAATILKDRPTIARVLGIAGMLAGLAIIAGPGLMTGATLTPVGDAMFIVAGGMWAVFTLLTKLWKVAPIAATAAVSVLSAVVYVPGYLAIVGVDRLLDATPSMLLAQVVVQGILSGVVAVIVFTRATELLGAARATLFPAMVPAVAIILGIPLAGEIPTALQLVGVGVVTAALLVALGVVRADVGRVPRRDTTHR